MTLGGAGVYADNLCRELAKLGHEVHVISSSLKNKITQTSRNLTVHGVPVLDKQFLKTFSFWLRIRRCYRALQENVKFDILHTNVTSGFGLTNKWFWVNTQPCKNTQNRYNPSPSKNVVPNY